MIKIIEKLVDELTPYENNARVNDKAVESVAKSIKEFGFKNPIIIDKDGVIVAGHTRLKALISLGVKTAPCIIADDLTDDQIKAFRIADNSTAQIATWNLEKLNTELASIDLDMAMFGLDEQIKDIEKQFAKEIIEDEVPEVSDGKAVTELGDIWQLGRHRLMCGDSTDALNYKHLTQGVKVDLTFTDPPYGVKRDKGFGGERAFGGGKGKKISSRTYEGGWDDKTPNREAFNNLLEHSKQSIIWGGNFFTDKLPVGEFWIVWDKHQTMPTFGDCELAWTNIPRKSVKKYDVVYNGLIGKEKERFHPTQKPVKLCADVLSDFTAENETVLDVFGGSGSTLIACEQLNRICYMMELDPKYCDVIIKRWETLTGEKANKVK